MTWKRTSVRAAGWLLAMSLLATPALAQWTGKGEAGMALANGNTDSTSANARIAFAHKHEKWEESGLLAGNYVRSDGETTARRWEAGLQERYEFSGRTFWYGGARYEEDDFSGFNYQAVLSTGLGRKFIDEERTKFSGQIGVGYKRFEIAGVPPAPDETDSNLAGVATLDFNHQFNDATSVYDKFTSEVTSENNYLQNEIGLQVKMTGRLLIVLAYQVRHNTDPPAGFRKTDTLTTVNLAYEVK
mgnify:CR=1 FL=1